MSRKARRALRSDMRLVLSNLDQRWLRAASTELCTRLSELFRTKISNDIEHVLAWSAFFPGEAELSPFVGEQIGLRKVYLPRSEPNGRMTFIEVTKDWVRDLEPGSHGIPEPKVGSGAEFDPSHGSRAAVIVPGLAFDKEGNRLGRGGGYYDRFLAESGHEQALKIGVGFSLQFVDLVPTEHHDIGMDWLCHERDYFKAELATADTDDDFEE